MFCAIGRSMYTGLWTKEFPDSCVVGAPGGEVRAPKRKADEGTAATSPVPYHNLGRGKADRAWDSGSSPGFPMAGTLASVGHIDRMVRRKEKAPTSGKVGPFLRLGRRH